MARDIIEIIDHLGWTSERELHILVGIFSPSYHYQNLTCAGRLDGWHDRSRNSAFSSLMPFMPC
jgi:hypothetical protein